MTLFESGMKKGKKLNMKTNKKRTLRWPAKVILCSLILTPLIYFVYQHKNDIAAQGYLYENPPMISNENIDESIVCGLDILVCIDEIADVYITNYGLWDGDSGPQTASGLTIDDFTLNGNIYQYNGFDVIATANTTRWNRQIKSGYRFYELYDIVRYVVDGVDRQGIVLDVCGACHGIENEEYQRIDILTTKNIYGKTKGKIYE